MRTSLFRTLISASRVIPSNRTMPNFNAEIKQIRLSSTSECKKNVRSIDNIANIIKKRKFVASGDGLFDGFFDNSQALKKSLNYINNRYLMRPEAIYNDYYGGGHREEKVIAFAGIILRRTGQYLIGVAEGNKKSSSLFDSDIKQGNKNTKEALINIRDAVLQYPKILYPESHAVAFGIEIFLDEQTEREKLAPHADRFFSPSSTVNEIGRENIKNDYKHLGFFVLERSVDTRLKPCNLNIYRYPYKNECISCGNSGHSISLDEKNLMTLATIEDKTDAGYIIDQNSYEIDGGKYEVLHSRDERKLIDRNNSVDQTNCQSFRRLSMVMRMQYSGDAGFKDSANMCIDRKIREELLKEPEIIGN